MHTADTDRDRIDLADVPTLDLASITLGEMAEAENQSGRSFDTLLRAGSATRRLLALWLDEYRRSTSDAPARSWRELSNLRPLGGSSSSSRSDSAGRRPRSSD